MSLRIVSRSESGLPTPTTAPVEPGRPHSLVLHHWGNLNRPTNSARARELRQLHLNRIGPNGEAYNWMVGHDAPGVVWELRGRGRRPGGQRNNNGYDNNTGTRSIVVNGDYRNPGNPTGNIAPTLIETIAQLVAREHMAGDMPDRITHGHGGYVRPDGHGCCQATSCPGTRLMAAIPTINTRIQQLLEEDEMAKIKLEWWAENAFEWAIKHRFYTEETDLSKVRETYDMQRIVTLFHRFWVRIVKPALVTGGGVTTAVVINEIVQRLGGG